jgi:DNA-binding HxlR family transcriptional regulator
MAKQLRTILCLRPCGTLASMRIEECPVKTTVDVIGGKWKPLILFELKAERKHFGELRRALYGVRHKVLIEQLRQLEADGIVERSVQAGAVMRTEYRLSGYGESLRPILQLMAEWGIEHHARKEQAA